jgi:hypothetical protein
MRESLVLIISNANYSLDLAPFYAPPFIEPKVFYYIVTYLISRVLVCPEIVKLIYSCLSTVER